MSTEPRISGKDLTLTKEEFLKKFKVHFFDSSFNLHHDKIDALAEVAWNNYKENHKSPKTTKAQGEFFDPEYELSVEWLETKNEIEKAQRKFSDTNGSDKILIVSGADRNDQSCPGEISKTSRLVNEAKKFLMAKGADVKVLDLSLLTSEYGKMIYPCKGCVSTAMPLCHWPCSCYPNHALHQVNDWMNEIYPMFAEAHGIFIITPVYWFQAPSSLKLLIDRLVCADGGNPDPTSTHGKNARKAKELEDGWTYPKHLAGRVYSVFVHGDAEGATNLKNILSEWLVSMELIPSIDLARYIGYYGKYSESHLALDKEESIFKEIENVTQSLLFSVRSQRRLKKELSAPPLKWPRPK